MAVVLPTGRDPAEILQADSPAALIAALHDGAQPLASLVIDARLDSWGRSIEVPAGHAPILILNGCAGSPPGSTWRARPGPAPRAGTRAVRPVCWWGGRLGAGCAWGGEACLCQGSGGGHRGLPEG